MAESSDDNRKERPKPTRGYNACPNCGHELSPWQQVLLSVDRALVCKNCWHRIILDINWEDFDTTPAGEKD